VLPLALALVFGFGLALAGCSHAPHVETGPSSAPPRGGAPAGEVGTASYYASKFHGRKTASGERYDQDALTAAHRTLSFGTRLRITNLDNGRAVEVRVNDRLPKGGPHLIDVSRRAASELDFLRAGVAKVRVEVLAAPR
jgi:rare lipoprotein A